MVLLEHERTIGGTSARSSGTVWVPDNPYMRKAGITGDREKAETYLNSLIGDHGPPEMWRTFLENASSMIEDLAERAGIVYRPYMEAPDYRQDQPGAAAGWRPLEPLPFDGRTLGADFEQLASPLPELMLFGGLMVTRAEAAQLLTAGRSLDAFMLGASLICRYLRDRLSHRRGTRLVLGNALIARLWAALKVRHVKVRTGVRPQRLVTTDQGVGGIEVATGDGPVSMITARRGVILAGGGFPANADWRKTHLPAPSPDHTPAASGCDGSSIQLALDVGAALGPTGIDNALWFPSSITVRPDGSTAVYPHIVLDRSKPGLIAVDQAGRRFVNEAVSYHEFVRAMYRANEASPTIPAWLVCDRASIRRYGLGLIRPRTLFLGRYVESGYLKQATSIADLAREADISPQGLEETVARYNALVAAGEDADFHKGETVYDRANADPSVKPNPCLGPIRTPPFYAVAVYPTPLGTSHGLLANVNAQVCRADGSAIEGLYVCGNDMQSAFGGEYPGAGGQLGQAMTFAWIAARHAARGN